MEQKSFAWENGSGFITVDYDGHGDGTITVTSDENDLFTDRFQQVSVRTTDGSNIVRNVTIRQAAKERIDLSSANVTASPQTYIGSSLTPTPTVVLNGQTIPSTGYDIAYSNNINAGTATIIITGKGDYTGTAYGSFTINKASRTVSFVSKPAYVNVGSSVTVNAVVSVGGGTISYISSDSNIVSVDGNTITGVGGGIALITAIVAEQANYESASATFSLPTITVPDGVDLGLPSGLKWAPANLIKVGDVYKIGDNPEDFGCYASWGNIDGYNSGEHVFTQNSWAGTPGSTITSDEIPRNATYDIAYARLGPSWHIPTRAEFQELINYTDKEYISINGVNGWKYMKKTDHSIYIFIPCSGYISGGSTVASRNVAGECWTSTNKTATTAYFLYIDNAYSSALWDNGKSLGISVRAVKS